MHHYGEEELGQTILRIRRGEKGDDERKIIAGVTVATSAAKKMYTSTR